MGRDVVRKSPRATFSATHGVEPGMTDSTWSGGSGELGGDHRDLSPESTTAITPTSVFVANTTLDSR